MKKLLTALVIASTVFAASTTANACDCGIQTINVDNKDYAYTFFQVEAFVGDYVTLKSSINGETGDYYIGFIDPLAELEVGDEAVILYDMDKDYEIARIIGVENN